MFYSMSRMKTPLWFGPALSSNIRQGWKWLTATNGLAYYTAQLIMTGKKLLEYKIQGDTTQVGSILACKYYNRVEVTESENTLAYLWL